MPKKDQKPLPLLIVGAGMTGLSLAFLIESGFRYGRHRQILFEIVDKGRGVGGRIATRRTLNSRFDHGALEIHDESLKKWPSELECLVTDFESWNFGPTSRNAVGGMTNWTKWIAGQLETKVQLEQKIESIEENRMAVLTCPWPQSHQILKSSKIDLSTEVTQATRSIAYDPCIVGLFEVRNQGPNLEPNLSAAPDSTVISEQSKRKVSDVSAFTMQMGPEWSRARFDQSDEENLKDLNAIFASLWSVAPPIVEFQLKKWRYARPSRVAAQVRGGIESPLLAARAAETVVVAGDAFAGPTLADAAQSAVKAYKLVLEMVNEESRE